MFNINQFNKVAGDQPSKVLSTTMDSVFLAAESENKNYSAYRFETRTFHPGQPDELQIEKLVFGTFDPETNRPIKGTDLLEFNVGSQKNPLVLTGETDEDKLSEIVDYPVYFGTRTETGVDDLNQPIVRKTNWMTIGKAGSIPSAKPATAFDMKALITGKNITTGVDVGG